MRAAFVLAFALSLLGCIAPITPMERLQQSANEVASALRWSRTDIVAEYVAPAARDEFLARHAVWDGKTRVMDLELAGIYLRSSDYAEAILSVMWLREDGAIVHTTEISQVWKHEGGSFRMINEVYRSGDKALFDMLPKKKDPKKDAAAKDGADKDADPTADDAAPAPEDTTAASPHARTETRVIRAE
jgi:hypothetical protein